MHVLQFVFLMFVQNSCSSFMTIGKSAHALIFRYVVIPLGIENRLKIINPVMLSRKGVIVKYTLGLDNNCVKYHLIRDMLANYIYDVYVMKDIFRYIKMIDLKCPWVYRCSYVY